MLAFTVDRYECVFTCCGVNIHSTEFTILFCQCITPDRLKTYWAFFFFHVGFFTLSRSMRKRFSQKKRGYEGIRYYVFRYLSGLVSKAFLQPGAQK
jgi:hypothetical protein